MKKLFTATLLSLVLNFCVAQVKPTYLYNTSTPYGTLDIRTTITSTHYYYLQEDKTFAFRETSGVRNYKYLDMTSTWDSSPYKQGNLRKKNGSSDQFILNYRLLFPGGYSSTYAEGYPLILFLHGGAERGNCFYNACYHADWNYNPNTNSPAAPTASTSKLLNNDHNLNQGGKVHLDARNLAGTKLPNDPSLAARSWPGFVLVPQMFNDWDSLTVQDAIRLVQLVAKKYNIDDNRIYVHGLSVGGKAVWQTIKRAPWLFAAALPMAANNDAYLRKQNLQSKVAHIPLWIFQGGKDTNPTPAYTNKLVSDMKAAGANVKYSLYADVGHTVWHKAFAEPQFFSWIRAQNKSNIHVYKGITAINGTTYPKLMMAEGFFKYQWERNGVILSTTTNTLTVKTAGTYRARFSRVANPTASQWNQWSAPVTITSSATATARAGGQEEPMMDSEEHIGLSVFPNPGRSADMTVQFYSREAGPVHLEMIDALGRAVYKNELSGTELSEGIDVKLPDHLPQGIYFVIMRQGRRSLKEKVLIQE